MAPGDSHVACLSRVLYVYGVGSQMSNGKGYWRDEVHHLAVNGVRGDEKDFE